MKKLFGLIFLTVGTLFAQNAPSPNAYFGSGAVNNVPKICSYASGLNVYCPSKISDNGTNLLYNGTPIGTGAVSSVFGRTGAVTAVTGDYSLTNISAGSAGTGIYDFSGATNFKLPVAAGYTGTASGECGHDSTNHNFHCYDNGADNFIALFASASPPTSGHVAGFLLTSGAWTLQDLGVASPFQSLTTTGSSGAATLSGGVLNIPNYAGGVTGVSNSDGTLTISPTTGAVVGSLALGHANTWTGTQNFSAINASSVGATTPGTGAFTTVNANTSFSIGSSAPTGCGSATGCIAFNENSVAGTPTSGEDYVRADSTTHSLLFSFNNGAEAALPTSASPTFTGTVTSPIFNATTVTSGYKLAGTAVLIFPDSDTASIAVGSGAGAAQSATSANNTFVGTNAGHAITSGINHTAVGNGADGSATTVNEDTAFGSSALANATGGSNTGIGNHACSASSFSGGNNVCLGDYAGGAVTSGAGNVIIGNSAGDGGTNLTTGSNNILIGYIADGNAAGDSSETVIGYNISGHGNNTVTMNGSSGTKIFIGGTYQVSDPSAPTVSSNAGTGSLTHGTDNAGIIATGTASTTSTLTFNQGWATWASCTVNANNATAQPYISAISNTAVTFTYVTTGTPTLYYTCFGA
jgi:hypothetical protein